MKKSIYFFILLAAFTLQGCVKEFIEDVREHHEDHENPQTDPESTTVVFSRNQMIVRFDDTVTMAEREALRGTDPKSEYVLEYPVEQCNCADSSIELWTIDTTATGVDVEKARDRLNRGDSGSGVKGDVNFEVNIPIVIPIAGGGGDNPQLTQSTEGDVIIAVLDTGLDYYYDRAEYPYVLKPEKPVCENELDNWNFVDDTGFPGDDHGHGTYVTKIIRNGLEPNIGFKIIPLKVFDNDGRGTYSNILCAMNYLKQFEKNKNIDIVNASFGGTMSATDFEGLVLFPELIEELRDDTVFIASAGNESQDVDNGAIRHFPSGFESANILSVGGYSTSSGDIQIHPVSNRGRMSIDMATYFGPFNLEFNGFTSSIAVNNLEGTSYSAALTTAIAAGIKGRDMGITDLRGFLLDDIAVPNANLRPFIVEGKVIEVP